MPEEIVTYQCAKCKTHKPKHNMLLVQQIRSVLPQEDWEHEKKRPQRALDVSDTAFCDLDCLYIYLKEKEHGE